jgi:hypothetical protein
MQLFTVGVNQLDEDGTPRLDANGQLDPQLRTGRHRDARPGAHGLHVPDQAGLTPASGRTEATTSAT